MTASCRGQARVYQAGGCKESWQKGAHPQGLLQVVHELVEGLHEVGGVASLGLVILLGRCSIGHLQSAPHTRLRRIRKQPAHAGFCIGCFRTCGCAHEGTIRVLAQIDMSRQLCAQKLTFLGRAASSSGRFLARLKVPLTYPSTCTTSR